jgi:hypothetical protein
MNFTGIICRHIFKVATQLNLEELSHHLFPVRWRKDPNEITLAKMYRTFYNNTGELGVNRQNVNTDNIENNHEDYEYLLNRIWYKVKQIVEIKPETAKNFYILLDNSVKDLYTLEGNSKNSQTRKIKNPETIKPKGNICFK